MKPKNSLQEFKVSDDFLNHWSNASKDLWIKFFEQSEKRLDETIKSADTITTRAYSLLALGSTIFGLILSYWVSHSVLNDSDSVLVFGSFLILMLFGIALYKLVRCIAPYRFEVKGSEPSKILKDGFIKEVKADIQLKNFLFSECESYQNRITHNHGVNKERMALLYEAILIMALSPLSLLVSWGLFLLG
jgi:hypothetical protein